MRLAAAILLAAWPLAAAMPTPRGWFGHQMGEDRTVLDWDKVTGYFAALARASDRVRVAELGKSTEGRPFVAVYIARAETLRHLDRYIEIQRRLADPRITSAAEAAKLAAEGKAMVMVTCSVHATELASTQTAIEFVYRLLTEDKPRFRAILDNTVFVLVPSLNPDGLDKVTAWYRKTLGTPFEGTAPPELYQKYVGHDNNRDWVMLTQAENRLTVEKLHRVFHPQIVYDVHQQGQTAARIFIPPWLDPFEPNIDPILIQETDMIGTAMAADLTAAGKTGVAIHATYDLWTPTRHYQAYHGGLRILTESASARLASPVTVSREELDRNALGYDAQAASWNHLEPWPGGTWRLRDIVSYQLIAFESCLYNAAIHREDLLRAFYEVGRRQTARRTPWGFVIPARQRDPGATRRLLQVLEDGQVEMEQAPNGDRVVRMAQPYSGYAKALLERQDYPDLRLYPGGPPQRPYDVTAHTLPLLMGVDVRAVEKPVEGLVRSGGWQAPPPGHRLSASDSDTWMEVNRAWGAGPVWRDPVTGDFSTVPRAGWKEIRRPRIGLYRSSVPSIDEGWTRWLLEQFGFAFARVENAEIQRGGLQARYDVLVFPDQSASAMASGFRPGEMPEEYCGGLGDKGAEALKHFASAGGTLVFLNRATDWAGARLGLKATNAVAGVPAREYFCPGSLLNVRLARHPLTLGLPEEITVWNEHSPVFEAPVGAAVACYADNGVLASGWLLGEKYVAGRAPLLDVRLGNGHAVLFGMAPQYRGQSYQTFKLLFNALLLRQLL